MNVLRTSDDRFDALVGFSLLRHYVEVPRGREAARCGVHYLDEGPASGAEKILLMHGEPSWSYLYRKMIGPTDDPPASGHRARPGGLRALRQAGGAMATTPMPATWSGCAPRCSTSSS